MVRERVRGAEVGVGDEAEEELAEYIVIEPTEDDIVDNTVNDKEKEPEKETDKDGEKEKEKAAAWATPRSSSAPAPAPACLRPAHVETCARLGCSATARDPY